MYFSWYQFTMLAFEANSVIGLRLKKISRGGPSSVDEMRLMFTEKLLACAEVTAALAEGATAQGILELYRSKVAVNQLRLDVSFS